MKAKDLKEGAKLNLWRRGQMRLITVKRVWVLTKSVMVDYDDGTSDLYRPWDDLTPDLALPLSTPDQTDAEARRELGFPPRKLTPDYVKSPYAK